MPENAIPAGTPAAAALQSIVNIVRAANSPDAWEAQRILLRRLALQGDVINSRVPPPQNITEIGGYINLLDTLQQPEMRAQALAGILGVAGPNPPLGWMETSPPLTMIPVANDRPEGAAQQSIPLYYGVRSDFRAPLEHAIAALHEQGCVLPLQSPALTLPPATPGIVPPDDALPYLGRVLHVVPAAVLTNPATDPLALARFQGTTAPFEVMARVLSPGAVAVPPANFDAMQCDSASCVTVALLNAQMVAVAPVLAAGGFYRPAGVAAPGSNMETDWSRFENVTGLISGKTKLGDELHLLYDAAAIQSSVFNSRLNWTWDGAAFSS